jgi:hypothetical protein
MQLMKVPEWQKSLFDTYYVASTNKRQAIDVTIYYDIKKACTNSENFSDEYRPQLVLNVAERVQRRLLDAVEKQDPYLMTWYWDALVSVCHIWNQALESEAYELANNCKFIIDIITLLPEYREFVIMVGAENQHEWSSNLKSYLKKIKQNTDPCN